MNATEVAEFLDEVERLRSFTQRAIYRERSRQQRRRQTPEVKERNRQYARNYETKNRVKIRTRVREKLRSDPQFKLAKALRVRMNMALKTGAKAGSAVRDLGCTIAELKVHLERQFTDGMSWTNHGKWHIDHIRPLASFDLTDREQFLQACHYSNLQPLWAADNIAKSDRLI